ncbi:MAG: hypothetical protein WKF82_00225 [Nocardioidaceae bacterium]
MSKPEAPLEQLFVNLLDDAAMFPPGNASPAEALASHLQHRVAPYADFIGPLLVHVNRWEELSSAHAAGGSPPLDVVVLGSTSLPAGGPRCVGFEVAVSAPEAVDGLAEVHAAGGCGDWRRGCASRGGGECRAAASRGSPHDREVQNRWHHC